ncbi:ADP-ribosyl-[dinitrogen reductase] hydrolase [Cohnella endophytica]|uniref:ADP-ribosyl-[dinitrogen reductase] hydrolase n=1 Tax=Cohnella endophytica TaxID=2419778 RepID=A0A494XKA9_9BACL|nr:ADP-ribosyl-[dinitrogen reductase] hydrolase [Cohnella endophytica]
MDLMNRIKGGIYGVAVGDALGGTTEFMSQREIASKHGYLTEIIGGGVWRLEPGEVTDDTMMTLCVAEGILENPKEPMNPIGERFLQWFRSKPKDVGNIIMHVLSTYEGNWFEAALLADLDIGQSAGNGSLMRCLPAALCYSNLNDVLRVSRMQSRMTHYDERCDQACEIYNRIAFRILNHNVGLVEAIESEIKGTEYETIVHEEPKCDPSGFVVHTFRWVLHILITSNSFADVVQRAANLGGDSDTIGAIAGGLAGVYYGYEGIPASYADKIIVKDRLDAAITGIITLRNG